LLCINNRSKEAEQQAGINGRCSSWSSYSGNPRGIWLGIATNHLEKLKNSERRKFAGVWEVVSTTKTKAEWRILKVCIMLGR